MTTAIERFAADYEEAVGLSHRYRDEAERLRADRDRLAARVAELEAADIAEGEALRRVINGIYALARGCGITDGTSAEDCTVRVCRYVQDTEMRARVAEARVAELEAAALVAESAQREADLQTLVGRARDVPADREAQGRAWAASCVTAFSVQPNGDAAKEERARVLLERRKKTRERIAEYHGVEADVDPCPVDAETLAMWTEGTALVNMENGAPTADGVASMAEQLAWLTRQVAAMREGRK